MRSLVRGDQHEGIVGRGVAIDGDAIERTIGQLFGQIWQQGRIDARVGGHKAEHGGHVGADHARTLADASDAHGPPAHLHLHASRFGHGVGGHDAFCRLGPVGGLRIGQRSWQACHNAVHGQRLHDHAGRKRQHLRGHTVQQRSQGLARLTCMGQARCARARIGVARVDDQSPHRTARGQVLTTDLHRGGAKAVTGEHTGHAGTLVQQEHGEVFAVGFAHTRLGDADAHPRDRSELSGVQWGQIHRHKNFQKNDLRSKRPAHTTDRSPFCARRPIRRVCRDSA